MSAISYNECFPLWKSIQGTGICTFWFCSNMTWWVFVWLTSRSRAKLREAGEGTTDDSFCNASDTSSHRRLAGIEYGIILYLCNQRSICTYKCKVAPLLCGTRSDLFMSLRLHLQLGCLYWDSSIKTWGCFAQRWLAPASAALCS